jgi:CheY-like chemotaxis protein
VYGAVTEAGGEIRLWTEFGSGTKFDIFLPAAAPAGQRAPAAPDEAPHGNGETILVVEDEDAVREITRRILTRSGYQVLQAASPAEALEVYRPNSARIDAVLTDVLMPGMSGGQLIERLHEIRPDLPTLLMSGYTASSLPGGRTLPQDTPLVRKPFTAPALLRRLREVLDGR